MPKKSSTKSKAKRIDEDIEEIKAALKENYIQQKKLMNDLRELTLTHKKDLKKIAGFHHLNSGKNSGFNKSEPVPKPLIKLLHLEEDTLPRSKVTALIYQYFTDHKMCNKTKKEIIPNTKIRNVFGMNEDDILNFYNLQTWLNKVYEENKL